MNLDLKIISFDHEGKEHVQLREKQLHKDQVNEIIKNHDWELQITSISKRLKNDQEIDNKPDLINVTTSQNLKLWIESWDYDIYSVSLTNENLSENDENQFMGLAEFKGIDEVTQAIDLLANNKIIDLRALIKSAGEHILSKNKKMIYDRLNDLIMHADKAILELDKNLKKNYLEIYGGIAAIAAFISIAFFLNPNHDFTIENFGTVLMLIIMMVGIIYGATWLQMKFLKK